MSHAHRPGLFWFIIDNSLLLVAGTAAALVWANLSYESYQRVEHLLRWTVNDIGMVFFFGLAAKEVHEAMLPGGALSSPRQAAVPVLAAAGGMVAPALIYLALPPRSARPGPPRPPPAPPRGSSRRGSSGGSRRRVRRPTRRSSSSSTG